MLRLFILALFLVPTFSYAADENNSSLQIFFKPDNGGAAIVVLNEVGENSDLTKFIKTLAPQGNGNLLIQNDVHSITLKCSTGPSVASCTFYFINNFPNVVVSVEEKGFYSKTTLDGFSGVDVLKTNPNLTIPLTYEKNGFFFELKIGEGKFFAGGNKKQ